MKKNFMVMTLLIGAVLYAQDESGTTAPTGTPPTASAGQPDNSTEKTRYNTIKYGTETEIVTLIQTLKTEGADYLDSEIASLVENTRNQKILTGAFSFFGEREKSGLENRAMRAIQERDEEKNDTILAAIDYLGKVKAQNAAPVLKKLIDGNEKRFMNSALRSFGRISGAGGNSDSAAGGSNDAAEYLVDLYKSGSADDENRREIITALGAAGSAGAVQFLAGIASNNDERVSLRMTALESIAKIGDPGGLDAVIACISASDSNLRSTAVTALGPFSGQTVDQAILDAFRDSYYRTRIAAAQASRQRKLAAAVPYLKFRAERDENPNVKDDSIRALGAIADGDSVKILEDLFTERKNSDRVRITAGEMIMQIEPEKFLDRFVAELDEAKRKKQNALYNGLLKVIGETKSSNMDAITRRLMQTSGVVEKSYALDMAVNNRLTSLADDIRTLTTDKNESLAAKARRTLEKLGL